MQSPVLCGSTGNTLDLVISAVIQLVDVHLMHFVLCLLNGNKNLAAVIVFDLEWLLLA